jgi:hypothetical protein
VARKSAVDAVTAEADKFAANVLPIIREAQKAGATSLREIAAALNAHGVATARGGQPWDRHDCRRNEPMLAQPCDGLRGRVDQVLENLAFGKVSDWEITFSAHSVSGA